MIQFDTNGVTLFYTDANGQRVAASYTETDHYTKMLTDRGSQQQAARDNALVVTNYKAALAAIQGTIDMGRAGQNPDVPTTAPAKPPQKVVSDTGVVSYTPFVPPLADLVIPKTDPSTVSGLINTVLPAPADTQAIMFNMVSAIFRKMFPDA